MAYFEGHSLYQTDCTYFSWKFVNYGPEVNYDALYSGGSRLYAPLCTNPNAVEMMWRPVAQPCDGCPYYEEGTESGATPPGGYDV